MDGLSEPHRPRAPGLHRRNLDQDQHGAASRVGAVRTTVARQSAIRPLEDHDLPGRSASRSGHRTVADRRTHRWPELPPVRRGGPRAHAQAGRHRHHRQSRLAQRQRHSASHPRRWRPSSSSCPSTPRISTRSKSSSPSSNTGCERPPDVPSMPSTTPSPKSCPSHRPPNAQTTSLRQDTPNLKPSRSSAAAGRDRARGRRGRRSDTTPERASPTGRHNFRMLISRAGRRCSSRYSRYGVSTSSIHFMNARTRRDRLLRCATTRDTASARRRKSGMISTSAPLSKYRPIPKSGA